MENNSKLFVFEKKEVILIFSITVVISITTFTLGVSVGKKVSLKTDGYSDIDLNQVNSLKSIEEEQVEKMVGDEIEKDFKVDKYLDNEVRELVTEENPLLNSNSKKQEKSNEELLEEYKKDVGGEVAPSEANDSVNQAKDLYKPSGDITGKYTIQLASFESETEAQDFADGFIINGLDAVVYEVELPQKGNWFRVGVGVFNSMSEARQYLADHKQFFMKKEYLISKIE